MVNQDTFRKEAPTKTLGNLKLRVVKIGFQPSKYAKSMSPPVTFFAKLLVELAWGLARLLYRFNKTKINHFQFFKSTW